MNVVVYGALSMALVCCWLVGNVHWIIPVLLGTYVVFQSMINAEILRRQAIYIGWSPNNFLSFWLSMCIAGLASYIIFVS